MLSDAHFVVKKISELEKKYALYFRDKKFKITDCIQVVREYPLSIRIIDDRLPVEIMEDIVEMFWVRDGISGDLDDIITDLRQEAKRSEELRQQFYNLCAMLNETKRKRAAILEKIHYC